MARPQYSLALALFALTAFSILAAYTGFLSRLGLETGAVVAVVLVTIVIVIIGVLIIVFVGAMVGWIVVGVHQHAARAIGELLSNDIEH